VLQECGLSSVGENYSIGLGLGLGLDELDLKRLVLQIANFLESVPVKVFLKLVND